MAAAFYIWQEGMVPEVNEITFHTLSGTLKANKKDGYIWLDFPKEDIGQVDDKELISTIAGALDIETDKIKFLGQNRMDYLIELGSKEEVQNLRPKMEKLKEIKTRGFIVTASGGDDGQNEYDFVSRFFAPSYGIDEDPVTGSAHTALCPYWSLKLNKTEMIGCQLSLNRDGLPIGGVVKVKLAEDRVLLGGMAEIVKVKEI